MNTCIRLQLGRRYISSYYCILWLMLSKVLLAMQVLLLRQKQFFLKFLHSTLLIFSENPQIILRATIPQQRFDELIHIHEPGNAFLHSKLRYLILCKDSESRHFEIIDILGKLLEIYSSSFKTTKVRNMRLTTLTYLVYTFVTWISSLPQCMSRRAPPKRKDIVID